MPDDSNDMPADSDDQAPEDVVVTCTGGFRLPPIGVLNG